MLVIIIIITVVMNAFPWCDSMKQIDKLTSTRMRTIIISMVLLTVSKYVNNLVKWKIHVFSSFLALTPFRVFPFLIHLVRTPH